MLYIYIISFICCAAIILMAGKKLAHYGDLLAEKSGLSRAWLGLILMSAVTSLPELMVGLSSSAIVQSADLATGDIFGSCAFNLCILAIMDVFMPNRRNIFSNASQSHIMAASFGIILLAISGLGLFSSHTIYILPSIGVVSIMLFFTYILSVRIMYVYQTKQVVSDTHIIESPTSLSLKTIIFRYSIFAIIIILAASTLPYFANHIAELTGLEKSFVGTLFLAVSTSLPEIAVSLAAIKLGSVDMAVGNLLGSNIFNMFILFLNDVFYTKGDLLHDASKSNIITVFCVLIMTGVVSVGLTFRSINKKIIIGFEALFLILIYILNLYLLF
jgi:cation:H+ antiporter